MILLLALGTVVGDGDADRRSRSSASSPASALIGLLGHLIEVPSVAPTLGTMIGLGVGIDYSLFIVTRYRRRLAEGLDVEEAIARSAATSGSAVAFAGSTVVIALALADLRPDPDRQRARLLGGDRGRRSRSSPRPRCCPPCWPCSGPRIESLRVPHVTPEHHDDQPHGWARWARGRRDQAVAGAGRGGADPRSCSRCRCSTCASARRTSASFPRTRARGSPTTRSSRASASARTGRS